MSDARDKERREKREGYWEDSEEALRGGEEIPSTGFLSFYDRLRERVLEVTERRGGRLSEGAVRALLLVPDVFMLMVRLALDPEVPRSSRALIGGAVAYFVLPTDLLPEAFVGGMGYLDDLVLGIAVLSQAFGEELEPWAQKHWSGSQELRVVVRDLSQAARSLLGDSLYERVKRLLARRGVKVEEPPEAGADAEPTVVN